MLRLAGEREPEGRAFARSGFDADAAAHRFDDRLRDRQSDADALPERSRLDETLEKLSPVFFGDAGSRVGDVDVEFPAADFEPEIDGAFGGEFHGVAQKVGDHLNQPFAVRADVADGIFSVEGDPYRAVLRLPHAETALQLFHDGIEFHVGIFVAEGSGPRSSRDRGCRRVAVSVPRRWSG